MKIPQDDRRPLLRRQIGNRGPNPPRSLPLFPRFRGIITSTPERPLLIPVQRQRRATSALVAAEIQARARRDAKEPRPHLRPWLKRRCVGPGIQEHLLGEIFRRGPIRGRQKSMNEMDNRPMVPSNQNAERLTIAPTRCKQQILVGQHPFHVDHVVNMEANNSNPDYNPAAHSSQSRPPSRTATRNIVRGDSKRIRTGAASASGQHDDLSEVRQGGGSCAMNIAYNPREEMQRYGPAALIEVRASLQCKD